MKDLADSDLDFPKTEFAMRHSRVREQMAVRGLELLLVIAPTNVQYLLGSRTKGYREFQCLLFPIDPAQPLIMLTRLSEVAEYVDQSLADEVCGWGGREPEDPIAALDRILRRMQRLPQRVGIEVPRFYLSVKDYLNLQALFDGRIADASHLVEDIKVTKSPAEIAYVRRAAKIVSDAMDVAVKALRPGATECEVAGEIYRGLVRPGGDLPAGPINFVSGERCCYSHGAPTERVLRSGDSINIEFAGAYRRYCSTIGRQFSLGQPSERLSRVYDAVREASDRCIEKMAPGNRAEDAHLAVTKVLSEHNLDQFRTHITGYGIAPGYPPSWGESLQISGGNHDVLKPGMLISLEPAVFIHEERIGIRIIDNVLISAFGCELLSSFSRDITVL